MYTTIAVPDWAEDEGQATGRRLVRVTYGSSPISDFGIVQGSVHVEAGDRLVYLYSDRDDYKMGQAPDDHYRIYIRTLSGSEWYLDFGTYAFNHSCLVDATPYCLNDLAKQYHDLVPGIFYGKDHEKEGSIDALSFKPRKYFSILRNTHVHKIAQWADRDSDLRGMYALMNEITGRRCTAWERETMLDFLPDAVQRIHAIVINRDYLKFPKRPRIMLDMDPDEKSLLDVYEEKERILRRMAKWSKRYKKGKNPRSRFEAEFRSIF